MNIDLAVLCDAATLDSSGKLHILGVFDQIQAAVFPARHDRIALVLRVATGPEDTGEHQADIRLVDPDGTQMLRLDGRLGVTGSRPGASSHLPQILNLDGIIFPRPGVYRFEVRVDETLLSTLNLTLRQMGGATPKAGGEPVFFAPGGPVQA
jgi:hypothetical protein